MSTGRAEMAEGNGSYVPRAELAAHIKGIDRRFEDVAIDIAEIRLGIIGLTQALERNSFLGLRGRKFLDGLVIAAVAAFVSAAVLLFVH